MSRGQAVQERGPGGRGKGQGVLHTPALAFVPDEAVYVKSCSPRPDVAYESEGKSKRRNVRH
jgi:hypothetical protein